MVFNEIENVKIAAIAASVPENVVDMATKGEGDPEMEAYFKKFVKNTGIAAIHKADMSQTASDFCYTAAKQIEAAGYYKPEEIGVLVYLTQNPDYRTPSTACALHKRLGLSKNCLAFDINLGCSGFVYGVSVCASLLKSSDAAKALVLVGDSLARGRFQRDNEKKASNTGYLFGDASTAILLEKKDGEKIETALMSDGTGHKALATPYVAWKHPFGPTSVPGDDIAVFNFTISEVPTILADYMEKTGHTIEDYDNLVLHQANMKIIKTIAKRVNMPMEKVPISLDRFGNTSGSSVPLTIVDKYGLCDEDKEVSFLTSSFGIGLSWGVIGFKMNTKDILPLTIGHDTYDDGYPDYEYNFDPADENRERI